MVTCLGERERRVGHRKNMLADTYASYVIAAIRQLAGRVSMFLKAWKPDKPYMTQAQYNSYCVVQRKRAFL